MEDILSHLQFFIHNDTVIDIIEEKNSISGRYYFDEQTDETLISSKFKPDNRILKYKGLNFRRFENLQSLDISNCNLQTLDVLSLSLVYLNCSNNNLDVLSVPKTLKTLNCENNNLSNLPECPGLETVYCNNNIITKINCTFSFLKCSFNQINEINECYYFSLFYCHSFIAKPCRLIFPHSVL